MENNNKPEFLFDKLNYKILLIGLAVIALGFILMSGGGSEDPNVFNEEIFIGNTQPNVLKLTKALQSV